MSFGSLLGWFAIVIIGLILCRTICYTCPYTGSWRVGVVLLGVGILTAVKATLERSWWDDGIGRIGSPWTQ